MKSCEDINGSHRKNGEKLSCRCEHLHFYLVVDPGKFISDRPRFVNSSKKKRKKEKLPPFGAGAFCVTCGGVVTTSQAGKQKPTGLTDKVL